jgi:hypothetical protein
MAVDIRGFALCLTTTTAVLIGCGESSSSHQGPNPVAYVRVQTATSAGHLGGVAVRLERQGSVPLTAATGGIGGHVFEVFDAAIGEPAAVIVEPPAGYTAPAPRVLSLVPSDTVDVQILLEAAS